MKVKQKGFTLVEIAIVLVIIGLLLGGILKGQEMIVQAKIKNAMADFSGISAAYHGYQDRYRAIPGDDANAATRWTTGGANGTTAATSGDGNGVVTGVYTATSGESREWWDHLRRAGFVAGNGSQQPTNAFAGQIGVQTGDGNTTVASITAVLNGGAGGISGLMTCSSNIPDKVAIAIDTSMDDGLMAVGSVRGQLQVAPNPVIAASIGSSSAYQETGTNVYTLCRQI